MRTDEFSVHQEYPKVNGFVYPRGAIQLVEIVVDWGPPVSFRHRRGMRTTIKNLEDDGLISWGSGSILARVHSTAMGVIAVAGEGDFGSDGFFALLNAESDMLIWLASFDCSNPFEAVSIKERRVHARSNLGNVWKFPLGDPADFTVS